MNARVFAGEESSGLSLQALAFGSDVGMGLLLEKDSY